MDVSGVEAFIVQDILKVHWIHEWGHILENWLVNRSEFYQLPPTQCVVLQIHSTDL